MNACFVRIAALVRIALVPPGGLALLLLCIGGIPMRAAQAPGSGAPRSKSALPPGLISTFALSEDGTATDTIVLPNAALYIPEGQSPTPFLPSGSFTAVLAGFISSELRGQYEMEADLCGALTLAINGTAVLQTNALGALVRAPESIRLNKGTNSFSAKFRSPVKGDAMLRLRWIPKGGAAAPIPPSALSHDSGAAELIAATELHWGRELFIEHRCIRCHQDPNAAASSLELSLDAPSFEGIGSRREQDWLVAWISNPQSERATATMPRLFHASAAREDAEAAAAFLWSLKAAVPLPLVSAFSDENREAGQRLFEGLHCAACHEPPETDGSDPSRLSLRNAARKFPPQALVAFLEKPEADYAWIRMPNFKLTRDEAVKLAAYLMSKAVREPESDASADRSILVERGRKLVQIAGCLNCHSLKLTNEFSAKPLAQLAASGLKNGCLAETPTSDPRVPVFAFTAAQRQALRQFGSTDLKSLMRQVPAESAQRHIKSLKCGECHGKFDGFPPLEILGGKLKPEWSAAFISGQITYRPRSWLEARMPAFTQYASMLARGMAMLHGFPPITPTEPAIDQEAAKLGQKLVSADGGLICISCHAVGSTPATQVFDNAGINLAYAEERLLKSYFLRWIRNPMAIDPVSKMPVFFDEEMRSPIADIYDGDGSKQIQAIWQYLRLGPKMPPPATQAEQ